MLESDVRPPPRKPSAATINRRGDRTDFWFTSAARAAALVYALVLVYLSVVFLKAGIAVGDLSIGTAIRDLLSAAFWSLLLLIGSCYYSIPITTLVVAAVRGPLRRGRRRTIDPVGMAVDVAN